MLNGLARVFYVTAFFCLFYLIKPQACVTLDFGCCFV